MMNITLTALLSLVLVSLAFAGEKHLFILSGQSNMQGHRPQEAFTPAVEKSFGKENVIVVQDAMGGQPIHRWYKKWSFPGDKVKRKNGDLYDRLLKKVREATKGEKQFASVSFFWMQGERDARMGWGDVYEGALMGIHAQLEKDLGHKDINFVIGRLSDFHKKNKSYKDWEKVRHIQVKVADSKPHFAWINTDDLNDGKNRRGKEIKNDLHYSGEGYKIFGKRMAEAAIKIISKGKK